MIGQSAENVEVVLDNWLVKYPYGDDNYHGDEVLAREELAQAQKEAQADFEEHGYDGGVILDDDGYEYATLYRFDPVPRSALREDANVPPGRISLRVKVATLQLRYMGEAGDGSEAGNKALAKGVDVWAEVVLVEHLSENAKIG